MPQSNVGDRSFLSADGHRRIHDRRVHQGLEEQDDVEQVRLTHGIGPGNAGKGAEVEVDPDQVLESVDTQPGEHGKKPGLASQVAS